eukprot:TRINITY_DN17343_c0_g1_i1.p1 TRINITY_DN17343_c0_g1~~TRINITY_DN17343_c0_g1_i1.p1  ORF type:complete len:962 (-),score=178.67 TRINITY_DN17343_c0_g1_i1:58-2619(-)
MMDQQADYEEYFSPSGSVCPRARILFPVHTVVDYTAFSQRYSSNEKQLQNEIITIWNFVTGVFLKTLNVQFVVTGITIKNATGTEGSGWNGNSVGWNDGSCPPIDQMLNAFSFWREKQVEDTVSLHYHLISGCYSTATLHSLSWEGSACRSGPSDGFYGTAVTSLTSTGTTSFLPVLYEMGRVFGSGGNGINPLSNTFTRNSQLKMCSLGKSCGVNQFPNITKCVPDCTNAVCGDDGCGGICGTCSDLTGCVHGACVGMPPLNGTKCVNQFTCKDQMRSCGVIDNGCTKEFCGYCPIGSYCSNGACQCIPGSCVSLNANCGDIDDGCGNLVHCGDCLNCTNHRCEACVPISKEQACGTRVCGEVSDGCNGVILCGSCTSKFSCNIHGECGCNEQCSIYGECNTTTATCECLNGFLGDGYTCVPRLSNTKDCSISDFLFVSDSRTVDWTITSPCNIEYSGVATETCSKVFGDRPFCTKGLAYSPYQHIDPTTSQFISVSITRQEYTKEVGLFIDAQFKDNQNAYTYLIWSSSNELEMGFLKQEYTTWTLQRTSWKDISFPVGVPLTIGISTSSNCIYQPYFSGYSLNAVKWTHGCTNSGQSGVLANGPAAFSGLSLSTATQIIMDLYGCIPPQLLTAQLSTILQVPEAQILDQKAVCANRNNLPASPMVTSASWRLNGGESGVVSSLVTKLRLHLASGAGGLRSATQYGPIITASPVDPDSYVLEVTNITTAVSQPPAGPPQNNGIIAAVVILVILLAGLLGFGVFVSYKKYTGNRDTLTRNYEKTTKSKRRNIRPVTNNWKRISPVVVEPPGPINVLQAEEKTVRVDKNIPIMFPVNSLKVHSSKGKRGSLKV